MVLSMTGYGRAGALLHGRDIKVELRSVNARFFEYSSRLPRSCAFLEDKLKKLVAAKVRRAQCHGGADGPDKRRLGRDAFPLSGRADSDRRSNERG